MFNTASNPINWASFLGNFLLTILAILAVLYLLKLLSKNTYINKLSKNKNRLKVLETLSIGPKQKIVLLNFDNHPILIGVTSMNISILLNENKYHISNIEGTLEPIDSIKDSHDKGNKTWVSKVL